MATPLARLKKLLSESAKAKRAAVCEKSSGSRASSIGPSASPVQASSVKSMEGGRPPKPEQPLVTGGGLTDEMIDEMANDGMMTRREQLQLAKQPHEKSKAKPKGKAKAKAKAKAKGKGKAAKPDADASPEPNPKPKGRGKGKGKKKIVLEEEPEALCGPPEEPSSDYAAENGAGDAARKRPATEDPVEKKKRKPGPRPRQSKASAADKLDSMSPEEVMGHLQAHDDMMRLTIAFLQEFDKPKECVPTKENKVGMPTFQHWLLSPYWTRGTVGLLRKNEDEPNTYVGTFTSGGSGNMLLAFEAVKAFAAWLFEL